MEPVTAQDMITLLDIVTSFPRSVLARRLNRFHQRRYGGHTGVDGDAARELHGIGYLVRSYTDLKGASNVSTQRLGLRRYGRCKNRNQNQFLGARWQRPLAVGYFAIGQETLHKSGSKLEKRIAAGRPSAGRLYVAALQLALR